MIRLSSHILIFSYSLVRKRPVRSTLLPILLPFYFRNMNHFICDLKHEFAVGETTC